MDTHGDGPSGTKQRQQGENADGKAPGIPLPPTTCIPAVQVTRLLRGEGPYLAPSGGYSPRKK